MICSNCGKQVLNENSRFCTECGAMLVESETPFVNPAEITDGADEAENKPEKAEEVIVDINEEIVDSVREKNEEAASDTTPVFDKKEDEPPKYESFSSQPQYTGGMGSAGYNYANVPPQKVKKKRPIIVSLICGLITFILGIALFCVVTTFLFTSMFFGAGPKGMDLEKVPVGGFIGMVDEDSDLSEDATVATYLYDKLPEKDKENMDAGEFEEMLGESGIMDFVEDLMSDYILVVAGEKDEVTITNDDVLKLIEDNEKLIEGVLDRKLTKSDYNKIEKELEKMDFEETVSISVSNEPDEDLKVIADIFEVINNPGIIIASFLITIGVILILILLCNLHKPRRVLTHASASSIIAAGLGFLTVVVYDVVIKELTGEAKVTLEFVMNLCGDPLSKLMTNSIIFCVVGVALIIVNCVIGAIVKASRKEY